MKYAKSTLRDTGISSDHDLLYGMTNVMKGLALFNNAGYLHNDISPDNIMVTVSGRYILVDFGNTIAVNDVFNPKKNKFLKAKWIYNPPEYKTYQTATIKDATKGDVYAIGVLIGQFAKGSIAKDISAILMQDVKNRPDAQEAETILESSLKKYSGVKKSTPTFLANK